MRRDAKAAADAAAAQTLAQAMEDEQHQKEVAERKKIAEQDSRDEAPGADVIEPVVPASAAPVAVAVVVQPLPDDGKPVLGHFYPCSLHPDHPLEYLLSPYKDDHRFACDGPAHKGKPFTSDDRCEQWGWGNQYRCEECRFDLHPECFDKAKQEAEARTLKLREETTKREIKEAEERKAAAAAAEEKMRRDAKAAADAAAAQTLAQAMEDEQHQKEVAERKKIAEQDSRDEAPGADVIEPVVPASAAPVAVAVVVQPLPDDGKPVLGHFYPCSLHPDHPLEYLLSPYKDDHRFACDGPAHKGKPFTSDDRCEQWGWGNQYRCEECRFDLHPECFDKAKQEAEARTLKLREETTKREIKEAEERKAAAAAAEEKMRRDAKAAADAAAAQTLAQAMEDEQHQKEVAERKKIAEQDSRDEAPGADAAESEDAPLVVRSDDGDLSSASLSPERAAWLAQRSKLLQARLTTKLAAEKKRREEWREGWAQANREGRGMAYAFQMALGGSAAGSVAGAASSSHGAASSSKYNHAGSGVRFEVYSELLGETFHSALHQHDVTYQACTYAPEFLYGCDVCSRGLLSGAVCTCTACGFDVCPDCILHVKPRVEKIEKERKEKRQIAAREQAKRVEEEATKKLLAAQGKEEEDINQEAIIAASGKLTAGQSVITPMHEHALLYCQSASEMFTCSICKHAGSVHTLRCTSTTPYACDFQAHSRCCPPPFGGAFMIPAEEKEEEEKKTASSPSDLSNTLSHARGLYYFPTPWMHSHALQFFPAGIPTTTFKECDVCYKDGGDENTPRYHCSRCDVTIHSRCFRPYNPATDATFPADHELAEFASNPIRKTGDHAHPLHFNDRCVEGGGYYNCSKCKCVRAGPVWSCSEVQCARQTYLCGGCVDFTETIGGLVGDAELIGQLAKKRLLDPTRDSIDSVVVELMKPATISFNAPRISLAGVGAAVINYERSHRAWKYPPLGSAAGEVWSQLDPQKEETLWAKYAEKMDCNHDFSDVPLPKCLKVVVYLDLFRLQDYTVSGHFDTDMNAVVWEKILRSHSETGDYWKLWSDDGIFVAMEGEELPTDMGAFITHRWDNTHGVAAMSVSYFQSFVYLQAIRAGYVPSVAGGADPPAMTPLWVWCDLFSVPQKSFNSMRRWSATEHQVRSRLNSRYIQYVGLKFGVIAKTVQYFVPWVPMRVECQEDAIMVKDNHPLTSVASHLKAFGMSPLFHLSSRAAIHADATREQGGWTKLELGVKGWNTWQDQAYVRRIWCIAEYTVRLHSHIAASVCLCSSLR